MMSHLGDIGNGQGACDSAFGEHQVVIDVGLEDIVAPRHMRALANTNNVEGFTHTHAHALILTCGNLCLSH